MTKGTSFKFSDPSANSSCFPEDKILCYFQNLEHKFLLVGLLEENKNAESGPLNTSIHCFLSLLKAIER